MTKLTYNEKRTLYRRFRNQQKELEPVLQEYGDYVELDNGDAYDVHFSYDGSKLKADEAVTIIAYPYCRQREESMFTQPINITNHFSESDISAFVDV